MIVVSRNEKKFCSLRATVSLTAYLEVSKLLANNCFCASKNDKKSLNNFPVRRIVKHYDTMVPLLSHPTTSNENWSEARECQERIQCLEKALGFMQAELDKLQGVEPTPKNNKKRIQYDHITVWPKPNNMGMIEDWVNGNFSRHQQCPKPPIMPCRTASSDKIFRAQSVAPPAKIKSPNTANYCHDRANSAPPAPPQPFRRFVFKIYI